MTKLFCVLGSTYKKTMRRGIITSPFVRTPEHFKSSNDEEILTNWYLRIVQLEINVFIWLYFSSPYFQHRKSGIWVCHVVYM